MERQQGEVRETLERLRTHAQTLEERLGQEPDDDAARDMLEDAENGIEVLEPILADFEKAGVDPEELIAYAQTIEDWQRREGEISEKLK